MPFETNRNVAGSANRLFDDQRYRPFIFPFAELIEQVSFTDVMHHV